MALGRKPSGAYDAAFPVALPDGSTAFAEARVMVDANGNFAGGPLDSTGAPQFGPSGKAAVTGTFTATGTSALFQASVGRAIWVKLSGAFVGTVQVERCSDGTAATAQILTVGGSAYAVFTATCQEPVSSEDDAGVAYRLNCTAYTSGTITYRLGHS